MKTQVPRIKIVDEELTLDGEFAFEISPSIITHDRIPISKITFNWCVEVSKAELIGFNKDEILEMFGEKLKQDFIKLLKKT